MEKEVPARIKKSEGPIFRQLEGNGTEMAQEFLGPRICLTLLAIMHGLSSLIQKNAKLLRKFSKVEKVESFFSPQEA